MPASRAGSEMVIKISGDPAELQRMWKQLEADANKTGVKVGQEMAKGAKSGGSTMWDFVKGQLIFEGAKMGINKLMELSQAWDDLEINASQAALSMGEDMKMISDHARGMAENSIYGASEFAKAMGILAKQGQQTEEILATTDDAAELATATQSKLSDAFQVTAEIMRMYSIETDRTSDVMDMLAKGTVKGVYGDLSQLGDVLGMIAPQMHSLGGTFQDAMGVASGFGRAVSDAGEAMTYANITMRRLVEMQSEGSTTLKRYGIDLRNQNGSFKSLSELLDEMATKSMTAGDMMEMFTARGYKGMLKLWEVAKSGKNMIAEGTAEALGATGSAADYAGKMLESSAVRGAQLKNVFTEMAFVIKENITEPIEDIVIEFGVDFVKAVNEGARTFIAKVQEMKTVFLDSLGNAVVEWWLYWKTGAEYAWQSMNILFTKIALELENTKADVFALIADAAAAAAGVPFIGDKFSSAAASSNVTAHQSATKRDSLRTSLNEQYKQRQATGEEMDRHKASAQVSTKQVAGVIAEASAAGYEAGKERYIEQRKTKGVDRATREGVGTDVAMQMAAPKTRLDAFLDDLSDATKENTEAQKEQAKALKDEVAQEKERQLMSGKERSEADKKTRKEATAQRRAEWVVSKRKEKEAAADEKQYQEAKDDREYRRSGKARVAAQESAKGASYEDAKAEGERRFGDKDKDASYMEMKKKRTKRQMEDLKSDPAWKDKSDRDRAAEVMRREREADTPAKPARTKEEQKQWDDLRKQFSPTDKADDKKKGAEDKKGEESKKRTKAHEKAVKAQQEAEKKQDQAIKAQEDTFKKMGENWTREEQQSAALVKAIEGHGRNIEELKRRIDQLQRAA